MRTRNSLFGILKLPVVIVFLLFVMVACSSGGGANNTPPVADAGAEVEASKTSLVTLDGSASTDDDGDSLTYTWNQTSGTDVTAGTGSLSGENPSFTAPEDVGTLVFDLIVNDGIVDSVADTVTVNIFEDVTRRYFVDGDNGDDSTGDGSQANPFASIAHAILQITGATPEDIYVMTRANSEAYDETGTDLDVPAGTSLYGAYNGNWERDVSSNKTPVNANAAGVEFIDVTQDAWFSGFELTIAGSGDPGTDVLGVVAQGDTSSAMYVLNNIITTGNVQAGSNSSPGHNYGLQLRDLPLAQIGNNNITVGTAGQGSNGVTGAPGADGDNGNNGNQTGGNRASGGSGGPGSNGGAGGTRGGGLSGSGGGGGGGGSATAPISGATIAGGGGGAGGVTQTSVARGGGGGDPGGRGLPGAAGTGFGLPTSAVYTSVNGNTGGRGGHGAGGGGGGGGAANAVGVVGGGGGGGGEGGAGGFGGTGGVSGGASIGVWIHNIGTTNIDSNTILAGDGGPGGNFGLGGGGGAGGGGGNGAAGDDLGVLGNGGSGGGGGDGGDGGIGGYGGAGGGGPSFGVVFSGGMAPVLSNNNIVSAMAGNGGSGGTRGNGGEGGYSYALFDRDTTDAFYAVLNSNTLSSGTAGAGGSSSQLDTAVIGSAGMSGETNWTP